MSPLLAIHAVDVTLEGLAFDAPLPGDWLDRALGEGATADVRAPRAARQDGVAVPGRVTARLSSSGKDIVVRGRVEARLEVPCVRCLEPTLVPVDAELSLLLQPVTRRDGAPRGGEPGRDRPSGRGRERPSGRGRERAGVPGRDRPSSRSSAARRAHAVDADEYEFASEEAEVDRYDGETVVLDDFVRECLLLEIPTFPLCSESCPGIASAPLLAATPVSDHQVDPRLAPLGALRDRLEDRGLAPGSGPDGLADAVGQGRLAALPVRSRQPMLRSTLRGVGGRKRKNKK
ncbi:MAG: DUF177 domain-containing protein [Myxococcales bacterium]|nr:DUF177 domain-containing protein [Myxococcales bacterium]